MPLLTPNNLIALPTRADQFAKQGLWLIKTHVYVTQKEIRELDRADLEKVAKSFEIAAQYLQWLFSQIIGGCSRISAEPIYHSLTLEFYADLVLHRVRLTNNLVETISRSDVLKDCNFICLIEVKKILSDNLFSISCWSL